MAAAERHKDAMQADSYWNCQLVPVAQVSQENLLLIPPKKVGNYPAVLKEILNLAAQRPQGRTHVSSCRFVICSDLEFGSIAQTSSLKFSRQNRNKTYVMLRLQNVTLSNTQDGRMHKTHL